MGQALPFQILFSESATLFGRITRVYGEEVVTGACAQGATRDEVARAINRMIGEYLHESNRRIEQER